MRISVLGAFDVEVAAVESLPSDGGYANSGSCCDARLGSCSGAIATTNCSQRATVRTRAIGTTRITTPQMAQATRARNNSVRT